MNVCFEYFFPSVWCLAVYLVGGGSEGEGGLVNFFAFFSRLEIEEWAKPKEEFT